MKVANHIHFADLRKVLDLRARVLHAEGFRWIDRGDVQSRQLITDFAGRTQLEKEAGSFWTGCIYELS